MIIFSNTDKLKVIDLLEHNLHVFVFPGISRAEIENLMSHLEWMRQQKEELKASCRIETFPSTKVTQFAISFSFLRPVENLNANKT